MRYLQASSCKDNHITGSMTLLTDKYISTRLIAKKGSVVEVIKKRGEVLIVRYNKELFAVNLKDVREN